MISITHVWDETMAFARREAGILMPLMLATFVVGDAGRTLATTAMQAAGPDGSTGATLAVLISLLISMFGQLAATALVLRNGYSLGEAFSLGVSRLPKVIAIGLLVVAVALLMALPFVVVLGKSGIDVTAAGAGNGLPLAARLLLIALIAFVIWLGVRLTVLTALIVDKNPPLIEAFQSSFSMTRGLGFRLVGMLLLYLIIAGVVAGAATFVFGSLFALFAKATGLAAISSVLTALIVGLVSGTMSLLATLFVAHLYKALATTG